VRCRPEPPASRHPAAWLPGLGVLSGRCCTACSVFRGTCPGQDQCAGCGRTTAVRKGSCRLCWNQARADARATGRRPGRAKAVWFLDGVGACHQLFFAEMVITRGAGTTPPPKHKGRGRPAKPPPAPAGRPRSRWAQLRLLDDARRDLTRANEEAHAGAGNPWLAWAHYLAYRRGEARGWRPKVHAEVRRAPVLVLAGFADGDMVRRSELAPAMRALGIGADRAAEVLDEMGVLADDRRPSFEDWLERKLDGLAEGVGHPAGAWVRTLRDGGPRSTARHPATAMAHMNNLRPVLLDWPARHGHLREVTRDDVVAVLEDLHGSRRSNVLVWLRPLFAFSTRQHTVFRNPARGIKVGQQVYRVVQPLGQDDIDQAIKVAKTPADRLALVLAAVHAARPKAIRELLIEDVDLGNRRLTIAGRTRPIDELTHRVLLEWLDYRRTRWPATANPHLIINQ